MRPLETIRDLELFAITANGSFSFVSTSCKKGVGVIRQTYLEWQLRRTKAIYEVSQ